MPMVPVDASGCLLCLKHEPIAVTGEQTSVDDPTDNGETQQQLTVGQECAVLFRCSAVLLFCCSAFLLFCSSAVLLFCSSAVLFCCSAVLLAVREGGGGRGRAGGAKWGAKVYIGCRLTEMSQPSPVSQQATTAEQNRAEQSRAEQSRAEQSRAGAEQKEGGKRESEGARERGMEGARERGGQKGRRRKERGEARAARSATDFQNKLNWTAGGINAFEAREREVPVRERNYISQHHVL